MDLENMKKAMAEVMKKELGDLYVDREQHFLDHNFIRCMRKNFENTRSAVFKSVVGLVVISALAYVGQAVIHLFVEMVKK